MTTTRVVPAPVPGHGGRWVRVDDAEVMASTNGTDDVSGEVA